jgi:hypothetical protein
LFVQFVLLTSILVLIASHAAAPKPTNYLRFSATGAGVVNNHQTGMVLGNPLNYDIFRFSATGYDPIYNWVFRIHYGDQYEVFGYADISSCECDSCDSRHQKRVFTPCTLGYPDRTTSRAPTIFNEDLILYSYGVTGDYISYYYSDEFPLMLGVGYVCDALSPFAIFFFFLVYFHFLFPFLFSFSFASSFSILIRRSRMAPMPPWRLRLA